MHVYTRCISEIISANNKYFLVLVLAGLQGFCPLKIKITQFPGGFRPNFLYPLFNHKRHLYAIITLVIMVVLVWRIHWHLVSAQTDISALTVKVTS